MSVQSYQRQHGVALLLCLFFMMLFSAIAILISQQTQKEIELTQAYEQKLKAKLISHSLLHRIVYALNSGSEIRDANDEIIEITLNGDWLNYSQEIQFRIINASSLLSLDGLEGDVINDLLTSFNSNEDRRRSTRIVDTLIDWQDRDNEKRPFGKEWSNLDSDAYRPRNEAVQSYGELAFIEGMTAPILKFIKEWVLLYRPVQFTPNKTVPALANRLPELKVDIASNTVQDYVVIDIKVSSEEQSYRSRYLIGLWYNSQHSLNIVDYVR